MIDLELILIILFEWKTCTFKLNKYYDYCSKNLNYAHINYYQVNILGCILCIIKEIKMRMKSNLELHIIYIIRKQYYHHQF